MPNSSCLPPPQLMRRSFFVRLFLLTVLVGGCSIKPPQAPLNKPTVYRNYLAIVNGDSSNFTFCSPDTGECFSGPSIGQKFPPMVRYHDDRLFVIDSSDNSLKVFNARSPYDAPRVLRFSPGSNPYDLAFGPDGRVYVSCLLSNTIHRTDPSVTLLTDELAVPASQGSNPEGLCISNGKLYVALSSFGSGNTVGVIDLSSFAFSPASPLIVAENPQAILEAEGRLHVVCTSGYDSSWANKKQGKVSLIDPMTDTVDPSFIDFSGADPAFAVLADNGHVFIGGSESGLMAYDAATRQVLRGPGNPILRPSSGCLMGLAASGGRVWSCWFKTDGEALEFDADTFERRSSYPVGALPDAIVFVP